MKPKSSYRMLQATAKTMQLPGNYKHAVLEEMIRARNNGDEETVQLIIRQTKLQREKQRKEKLQRRAAAVPSQSTVIIPQTPTKRPQGRPRKNKPPEIKSSTLENQPRLSLNLDQEVLNNSTSISEFYKRYNSAFDLNNNNHHDQTLQNNVHEARHVVPSDRGPPTRSLRKSLRSQTNSVPAVAYNNRSSISSRYNTVTPAPPSAPTRSYGYHGQADGRVQAPQLRHNSTLRYHSNNQVAQIQESLMVENGEMRMSSYSRNGNGAGNMNLPYANGTHSPFLEVTNFTQTEARAPSYVSNQSAAKPQKSHQGIARMQNCQPEKYENARSQLLAASTPLSDSTLSAHETEDQSQLPLHYYAEGSMYRDNGLATGPPTHASFAANPLYQPLYQNNALNPTSAFNFTQADVQGNAYYEQGNGAAYTSYHQQQSLNSEYQQLQAEAERTNSGGSVSPIVVDGMLNETNLAALAASSGLSASDPLPDLENLDNSLQNLHSHYFNQEENLMRVQFEVAEVFGDAEVVPFYIKGEVDQFFEDLHDKLWKTEQATFKQFPIQHVDEGQEIGNSITDEINQFEDKPYVSAPTPPATPPKETSVNMMSPPSSSSSDPPPYPYILTLFETDGLIDMKVERYHGDDDDKGSSSSQSEFLIQKVELIITSPTPNYEEELSYWPTDYTNYT